ncbi:MAG: helix-hairpin-helix domain-containing protein, partial [Firmicutes bacterium]|nr:helix-hairpin-helix domain-containing protein [Bacillota bacterium]
MTIEGSVKTVRFSSDDGFHILVLDCNGKDIIASGFFPPVSVGEFVTLTGEYQNHPKFGKQFKASKSTKGSPTTTDTIKKYLGSGLFKGIGQKTAQYIVDEFGLESLKVIENTPHFLSIVKGVTQKKAQLIGEEFAKNKATQESVMFLQDKGITPNMALKIFKAYGAETIGIVTN